MVFLMIIYRGGSGIVNMVQPRNGCGQFLLDVTKYLVGICIGLHYISLKFHFSPLQIPLNIILSKITTLINTEKKKAKGLTGRLPKLAIIYITII